MRKVVSARAEGYPSAPAERAECALTRFPRFQENGSNTFLVDWPDAARAVVAASERVLGSDRARRAEPSPAITALPRRSRLVEVEWVLPELDEVALHRLAQGADTMKVPVFWVE